MLSQLLLAWHIDLIDVIISNEVSGKEKSLENLTLNIFTSNLHVTVTCSCCPYLYFGSAIMLVTYFVNFR